MANPASASDGASQANGSVPSGEFRLLVSLLNGKPEAFTFDQQMVTVGRATDCDLRIEHAGISRHQFTIERSLGAGGELRFRIIPGDTVTNPTYVKRAPAVEGALRPGDIIAVGEIRIVLEHKAAKADARRSAKKQSPLTMVLLVAVVIVGSLVGYLFLTGPEGQAELTTAQTPLFGSFRQPHCANPLECAAKAHEAYERGRKYQMTASTDAGNFYRAALEFARAQSYREQSGRTLGDMADVDARAEKTRSEAEAAFEDARFALKRAIASGDLARCAAEAELLTRIVPDDNHPYRRKLDDYRRTLPAKAKPKSNSKLDDEARP